MKSHADAVHSLLQRRIPMRDAGERSHPEHLVAVIDVLQVADDGAAAVAVACVAHTPLRGWADWRRRLEAWVTLAPAVGVIPQCGCQRSLDRLARRQALPEFHHEIGTPLALTAIRGTFFDFVDDPWNDVGEEHRAGRFVRDGLLVTDDGVIVAFGSYVDIAGDYPDIEVTHIPGRLITPGFIDGHIHFPQTRILGAYGHQLLPWLLESVFPEEMKYGDRAYAEEGATRFFDTLLASGTTTCQAFTSSYPVTTEVYFEEAARRGMRVIGGLTGIDRFAPDDYLVTPDGFYADSTDLIERYSGVGRNLYAITPRFGLGASTELLEQCRRLKEEHPDLWVNTHISENPSEIRELLAAHPDCDDYLGVYEKYGLVGPKFSGGHGVWLSDDEFRRFAESGASVTFCPSSNLFLGSGLFRLGRATDPEHRVKLSFGTDMGGETGSAC